MVDFVWNQMPIANFIIALLLVIAIHGLAFFILFKVAKRKVTFAFYGVCTAVFFIGFIFNLLIVCIMMGFISAACMSAAFFANLGDLRKFIANPFSRPVAKAGNFGIEKIYDTQLLYKNIETAVISLSNARIGAIMTFEKNTDLKDIMKNGVPLQNHSLVNMVPVIERLSVLVKSLMLSQSLFLKKQAVSPSLLMVT